MRWRASHWAALLAALLVTVAEGSVVPSEMDPDEYVHLQDKPGGGGATLDVRLSLWTDDDHPDGLLLGETNGVSWGDYDRDGCIDLFVFQSGNLFRNLGGVGWELAADLDEVLPPSYHRYGASFGDYDNDGLPDIGTAPRVAPGSYDLQHLLWNLGDGPGFIDVATDPAIVDVQPFGNAETVCWADVNDDGWLDLFVPVYPESDGGPGNFFLLNLGPTGPGGAYRFGELSAEAGLDNPPGTARPEGAQFADADQDSDLDLFSNGTLYQNRSSRETPSFVALGEGVTGIGLPASMDEGAAFFDYDLDGDQDLVVAYVDDGVRIWESRGDGTFFGGEPSIVDEPFTGLKLGLSAEDWDNDGDIDFTTRHVFRRNRLVEDGTRHFTVATHPIPYEHGHSAMPAWGDWDRDGDLDCALGNWGAEGRLYENDLYLPATPAEARRHLRVRPLRDSLATAAGLEVEYGAMVEVHLANAGDAFRRRKFVASSHGYLNQNEYTLHFGLPQDPAPSNPLQFAVSVDFPSLPAEGTWRVDEHVNPALGARTLASLADREIQVFRCGGVVVDGVAHEPLPLASPRLTTTAGGPGLDASDPPQAPPEPAPDATWFVGLAFDTIGAPRAVHVKEIFLDGQLAEASACSPEPFNMAVWDVTEPEGPVLVPGGTIVAATSPRNRRSSIPTDLLLPPGRSFRLVAHVSELRALAIDGPTSYGSVGVAGGLFFSDATPCSGVRPAAAFVSPQATSLSLRFALAPLSDELDPVGAMLRLDREPGGDPVLVWPDLQAPGYHVLRCDAQSGPCTPASHAVSAQPTYTDAAAGGEIHWYRVEAVNECTALTLAPTP